MEWKPLLETKDGWGTQWLLNFVLGGADAPSNGFGHHRLGHIRHVANAGRIRVDSSS
jgi:hypothetical protein